jgi:Tfp pilus assembly major pilin PilA
MQNKSTTGSPMKKQRGFSPIDLVGVVAISGILATSAIPAYQDHTIRANVAEALDLSDAARQAAGETHQITDHSAGIDELRHDLPVAADIKMNDVSSVTIVATTGIISIGFRQAVPDRGDSADTVAVSPVTQESGIFALK